MHMTMGLSKMTESKIGDDVYFIDVGRVKKGELIKRTVVYKVLVGPRDHGTCRLIYEPTEEKMFATQEQAEKEIFKRKLKGK